MELDLPFSLEETSDTHGFSVTVNNKRTYILQASDEKEKQGWLHALQNIAAIKY